MKDALTHFASQFAPPGLFPAGAVCISSLTGAADAFLARALAHAERPRVVLAVTPGIPDAERLADEAGLAMPGMRLCKSVYDKGMAAGIGKEDFRATYKVVNGEE